MRDQGFLNRLIIFFQQRFNDRSVLRVVVRAECGIQPDSIHGQTVLVEHDLVPEPHEHVIVGDLDQVGVELYVKPVILAVGK